MSRLIMEILTADDWVRYLVITDAVHEGSRVEVLHCLRQYSAGSAQARHFAAAAWDFLGRCEESSCPRGIAFRTLIHPLEGF
jgi:hypothetical protein